MNKLMRNLTSATLICGALTVSFSNCWAASNNLVLAEKGQTKFTIALAADAIPSEKTAATQLQEYLQKVTGTNFVIQFEGAVGESTPQILVGAGRRAKRLLPNQQWGNLGHDGIVIKTIGNKLVLAGGRPRGTLYAVNEFLEKSVGVRWWTPTEGVIPQRNTLTIASQNTVFKPPFAYREHFTNGVRFDPLFAARLKQNGHYQTYDEKTGGNYNVLGFVHTFEQLLPPAKYFKDHPEWYGDTYNGNKPCTSASQMPAPQRYQLNLSNNEMRRELTKNALEWIRKNPEAGMISISQNDNVNKCINPGDMAIEEREGSPSGPLLHFVNQVAADIEKEYPDFLVETLAYMYTQKPPRNIRPRRNVVIRLCDIGADFIRPLESEANREFQVDFSAWQKIAPNLYIWDYVTNYLWPYPNLQVLGPNLRYFARNKVFGVFEEGDAYSLDVADFAPLRIWLISKLLWNPEQDENKLIDEFMQGYYGAAAPHLRAYQREMHSAFLATGKPLSMFLGDNEHLTLPVANRAWEHFQAAEKAVATDAVLSWRVRRERLTFDNVIIKRYDQLKLESEKGVLATAVPQDIVAFIDDFLEAGKKAKIGSVNQQLTFVQYESVLRGRFKPSLPLPEPLHTEIAPAEIATRVIDVQQDQFRYHEKGRFGDEVEDALASDGKATRLIGQTDEWVLQYDIPGSSQFLKEKPWQIYAVVRAEVKAGIALDTPLFSAGVYDITGKITRLQTHKTLADFADGQYHLVDLGQVALDSNCYMWVAPPARGDVTALYIDRLILVRQ